MPRPDLTKNLLDIGEYANDRRLVQHGERYASFYGDRCNPAVYLTQQPSGTFYASQVKTENRDGRLVAVGPAGYAVGATAAETLAQIIGPVQPRDGES